MLSLDKNIQVSLTICFDVWNFQTINGLQAQRSDAQTFCFESVLGSMMSKWACLSFGSSKAFMEPGARTQGPPVTAHPALLSYSQGAHWGGVGVKFERPCFAQGSGWHSATHACEHTPWAYCKWIVVVIKALYHVSSVAEKIMAPDLKWCFGLNPTRCREKFVSIFKNIFTATRIIRPESVIAIFIKKRGGGG